MADPATEAPALKEEDLAPSSIASELSSIREGLQAEHAPETFELPGYGKRLQARYRVLSYDEVSEIGNRVAEQARAGEEDLALLAMCDTLISACVGFYTERDGQLVALQETDPALGDAPIRWGDRRLADLVGLELEEPARAREILRGVIPDGLLIVDHHNRVSLWMQRAREEIDRDF